MKLIPIDRQPGCKLLEVMVINGQSCKLVKRSNSKQTGYYLPILSKQQEINEAYKERNEQLASQLLFRRVREPNKQVPTIDATIASVSINFWDTLKTVNRLFNGKLNGASQTTCSSYTVIRNNLGKQLRVRLSDHATATKRSQSDVSLVVEFCNSWLSIEVENEPDSMVYLEYSGLEFTQLQSKFNELVIELIDQQVNAYTRVSFYNQLNK